MYGICLPNHLSLYLSTSLPLYFSTSLPLYLPVYVPHLSTDLSIYRLICRSMDLWISLSIHLSICECPSVNWSIYPSIYPSIIINPFIHPSVSAFLRLSVYPSIHLSIYLAFGRVLYLPTSISRTFQHSACSFARMLQRALTWLLLARFHGDAGIGQIRYHTKNDN